MLHSYKMLHNNFLTKMFQYSTHVTAKQIFECLAHRNKICNNTVRLFYNDKNSIDYLVKYLRKRQDTIDLYFEDEEKAKFKKQTNSGPLSMLYFNPTAPEIHDFFTYNWIRWWKHYKVQLRKKLQKHRYERNQALGPDLASAKFVIMSGGRVKFTNQNDWIDNSNTIEIANFPKEYQPDFVLEGLDLRGYPLEYENFYVISHLHYLKWLILRGCTTINDWSIDKIAGEYPTLEYLDISECKNVTERGLEALYKMPNLKQLFVTDFYNSAAFELTCLMLEDVNPHLKCEILKPEKDMLLVHGYEK